ncbi:DUF302 domain-containing protein [Halomonas sp. TRM85114]|uniref:DUF302 domain-containing protein n=1 Tax=Halomonas jincaotanensis TaxID=2810616 RepID=UPI001BD3BEB3|nr:DUF302 domain-containing protein [Halomonas jincaotanensis]MBS9402847.1 DUF302 domain-containing protein [Halomonas jincaotanensis]
MHTFRLLLSALAIGTLLAVPQALLAQSSGIESLTSQHDIDQVDERLRAALDDRGMTLVTVIDHAANASKVDLSLPPTRTFVFGNPEVGTPMMQCQGSLALDLPQKMVIRETDEGTRLEWNHPDYLAERHGLGDCELPLDKVAGALESIATEAADD